MPDEVITDPALYSGGARALPLFSFQPQVFSLT
jgi:hypothetical protein